MCHEEVRGGGEFLEDLVRGGFEVGSAAGWERFGKCLHDRAERDGEALREVAGPDVAIHRISNEFADDHWGFAMVGQGSEGSERKVWDHGAEGLRDFAIEVDVFGKETLIAKCFKTIQDGRETQDGIELGIIKNPERLLCAHAGRAEERVLACGGGVIQDGLDDRDGAAAGDRTWLTGRGAHEIANRFLDFIAGVAGQLAEYGSGGSGGACVGQ